MHPRLGRFFGPARAGHHGHRTGGHHSFPTTIDGAGSGEFTRGRRFSSEDLQLIVLAVLQEKPCHGYELIKELQTRSDGFYSPSPGMIYPALTYLEELGQVACTVDGNKKSYRLLDAGRDYLKAHEERVESLLQGLRHMARKMKMLRGAMAEEAIGEAGLAPAFGKARMALKGLLMQVSGASAEEQRQVAAILQKTVQEIKALQK